MNKEILSTTFIELSSAFYTFLITECGNVSGKGHTIPVLFKQNYVYSYAFNNPMHNWWHHPENKTAYRTIKCIENGYPGFITSAIVKNCLIQFGNKLLSEYEISNNENLTYDLFDIILSNFIYYAYNNLYFLTSGITYTNGQHYKGKKYLIHRPTSINNVNTNTLIATTPHNLSILCIDVNQLYEYIAQECKKRIKCVSCKYKITITSP